MNFYAGILRRKIDRCSEENKEDARKDIALWQYANLITDNEFMELMKRWNEKYPPLAEPEVPIPEPVPEEPAQI